MIIEHEFEQPSPSIEKKDIIDKLLNENNGSYKDLAEDAFIEGYKSNNHLDELEKWINSNIITHEDDFEYLRPDSLLKLIQELKTKE